MLYRLFEMIVARLRRGFTSQKKEMTNIQIPLPVQSSVFETPDGDVFLAEDVLVGLPAKVILYNDEVHTFDEVTVQLVKATGCMATEAEALAFEVDSRGLACVFDGELDECLRVSSVLEEIALHTAIEF